jgi:hypothetical protein
MTHFRLPRKIKKFLKKTIWLYPADKNGSSLMASPSRSQEDYTAVNQGIARSILDKHNSRVRRKEFRDKLDREIYVSDEQLKVYVDDIMGEDFRYSSYNLLIEAKKKPHTIIAYFNFINAYLLINTSGDCCVLITPMT